ncbi:hypothetical protein ACU686_33555 [Yinghuangia aomiensis]
MSISAAAAAAARHRHRAHGGAGRQGDRVDRGPGDWCARPSRSSRSTALHRGRPVPDEAALITYLSPIRRRAARGAGPRRWRNPDQAGDRGRPPR